MKAITKKLFKPTVPVLTINGLISSQTVTKVQADLKDIRSSTAKALAVIVNSPGGSATQGERVAEIIRIYAKKHDIPIYTFAEDIAASSGYQILITGDKVFADTQSLIGSIGTLTIQVNAQKAVQQLAIETRSLTSNPGSISNKSYLNNLSPELKQSLEEKVQSSKNVQIQTIQQRRGYKMTKNNLESVFNGDLISGEQALELGMIDGIGRLQVIMNEHFPTAKLEFSKKQPPFGGYFDLLKNVYYQNILNNPEL